MEIGARYRSVMPERFGVICEVEPATRPDLMHVRHQIGVLSRVATGFLIPDNHIGRATVSSVAVAHEVALMGGRAIACLNARDRNVLGFHRDLLIAAAYGVNEFLFVYGDRPETGARSDDLTVTKMLAEARQFFEQPAITGDPVNLGVSSGLRPVPAWKRDADFVLVQASYSVPELLRWRESVVFARPVYAGVMVLPSTAMARKLAHTVPELAAPRAVLDRLEHNPDAGVDLACELIAAIRDTAAFDGVHLIPTSKYRQVAARLEQDGYTNPGSTIG